MDLDGANTGNSPAVTATDVTFDNVDVTNEHTDGVCFVLGSTSGYGRSIHTVIENSRIHDCGPLPGHNQGHGIYVAQADGAVIRNNWIYDNTDRGIQLYPNSQGAHVYGNVIEGNGEGMVVSGDGETASSNNLVENNLIADSKIRWNVETNWPGGVVGTGNVVRNNCLSPSNSSDYFNQHGGIMPSSEGGGAINAYGNVNVDSAFVSATTRNIDILAAGPCAGNSVILKPVDKNVNPGGSVKLEGHATPANAVRVIVQVLRHGHWKTFAHTRLHADGSFALHHRLGRRAAEGVARLRARVPSVGKSRPVAIRVR
jgi:parallel beta-helix repeat protein